MTDSIDLAIVERPIDTALTVVEACLETAVDSLGETGLVLDCAKGQLLAVAAAGKAGLDGTRKLNQEMMRYATTSFDSHLATGRAVMDAMSLEDAVTIQRGYLEITYRDALVQGARLAAIALMATNDAVQPLRKEASAAINSWGRNSA